MSTITFILIILVISAFFSGMEIAFVSSNKLRFALDKRQKGFGSEVLSVFYKHPQQYISTMLVGNNICLVIYGMLMAKLLEAPLAFMQSQFLITFFQIVLATIIVLITSDFLPKTIFRYNPNLWLSIFSPLLLIFYIVLYPIAVFCTWLSIFILRIFGVRRNKTESEDAFSRIDFNYLVEESFEGGDTEEEIENDVKILQNALDFSNVKLRDCYIPRPEIVSLDYSVDLETLKQTFIETGYSKIIISEGNIDNIIGYIHSSELFNHAENWKEHINQIPFVPENMTAQKLMKMFMQEKKSMAVVVDEFGGTAGIVTLEDIVEEIFGEIEDEHDTRDYISEQINDKQYVFSGRLEIKNINLKYDLEIPESDEYDTLAGFILFHHQNFPKLNEPIRISGFTLKCTKITNNRIDLVKLSLE